MKKLQRFFKYMVIFGIAIVLFYVVNHDRTVQYSTKPVDLSNYFNKINMFRCLDNIKEHGYNQSKQFVEKLCKTNVILEPHTCREKNGVKVFLTIIAISKPSEFHVRRTIRRTWGSIATNDETIRFVFLMGQTNQKNIKHDIHAESRTYGDVIMGDFTDTYNNLTLKSIAMLKWAATLCGNAQYIVKVDTDVYLHVDNLLHLLKLQTPTWSIIGRKVPTAYPDRDEESKFYISYEQYPYSMYPSYITGPTYVISGDLLPSLEKMTYSKELLPFEDVYLTGFCGLSVKANLIMDRRFAKGRRFFTYCNFNEVINGHGYNPEELQQLHDKITGNKINCLFRYIGKLFFYFE